MTALPKNIDFISENLSTEELDEALGWYNFLRSEDRENVEFIIRYLRARGLQSCGPDQCPEYTLLNAIGSTSRKEANYGDVDFLFVISGGWDSDILYKARDDWEIDLRTKFDYEVDHFVLNEEYRPFMFSKMPDRSLITLSPKNGDSKSIHIVVQPGINKEEFWNRVDEEPRIVLDRIKNLSGGFFAAMEKITAEVFGVAHEYPLYNDAYNQVRQGYNLGENIPLLHRAKDEGIIKPDIVNDAIIEGKRRYAEMHRQEYE